MPTVRIVHETLSDLIAAQERLVQSVRDQISTLEKNKKEAAHAVEAGWVQVNQGPGQFPGQSYGGTKQSGIGREFSLEGMIDGFTHRKSVTVNLAY